VGEGDTGSPGSGGASPYPELRPTCAGASRQPSSYVMHENQDDWKLSRETQRISTDVPMGAFSKNLIAMVSGNRMHPWDAG
jgi:hypothetical protein